MAKSSPNYRSHTLRTFLLFLHHGPHSPSDVFFRRRSLSRSLWPPPHPLSTSLFSLSSLLSPAALRRAQPRQAPTPRTPRPDPDRAQDRSTEPDRHPRARRRSLSRPAPLPRATEPRHRATPATCTRAQQKPSSPDRFLCVQEFNGAVTPLPLIPPLMNAINSA
jgi:hypothetical protein